MATSVTLKPNAIDISGSTSGTTTLQASAVAGTTTLTLPAATDTLVGKATTDTLTNKTLTGAAMNGTLGATTPSTASVTTLTTSSTVTHSGGTANGVAYLDGSKVLTTGSALVFDGSNLGLGVTPSANAGQKTLSIANQTGGFAALTMGSNFTQAGYIGYNMGNTGTNSTWKYISADNGSALWFNGNEFRFMQFASGSAGATTSGTQAMTLDASGNLGIGTTSSLSPSSGRIDLTINGTSSAMTSFGTGNTRRGYFLHDATDLTIASETAGSLRFLNNGSERARIDSSGNLLVGTTSQPSGVSSSRLGVVSASSDYTIGVNNTNAAPYGLFLKYTAASPNGNANQFFYFVDSTAARAYMQSNGGLANYSGNNTNLSDRREKTNFAPAGSYLDKICAIPVQTFNYIDQNMEDDGGLTLGVVAQDVQAVAPELVMESDWGTEENPKMRLSIYQTDLQYALMKCIQEQQAIIQSLTARITALESA